MIIGIDPGLNGAVAMINGNHAEVHDLPVMTEPGAKKTKTIDEVTLYHLIEKFERQTDDLAQVFIERVGTMPGQGIASAFNFGRGVGKIEGALAPFTWMTLNYLRPAEWKKAVGIGAGSAKDASLTLARRQFPMLHEQLNLKKHDGRAEALLIALAGKKKGTKHED